jgi:hypothetical protein
VVIALPLNQESVLIMSRYIAALSPANPPPAMTILVFFIRPSRLLTIVNAVPLR